LKVLHGDRRDRINRAEPEPPEAEVACPKWLSPEARAVWARLAPGLVQRGILTVWDVDLFARFCALEVFNRLALEDVQQRGILVAGRNRARVKNPALQVVRDTGAELRALAARFGLTPSDRSQLRAPEAPGGKKAAQRLLS
ncbi:MAG: phage terminase small subunit P27 family, partial [Acidimicrobiia bacterium]